MSIEGTETSAAEQDAIHDDERDEGTPEPAQRPEPAVIDQQPEPAQQIVGEPSRRPMNEATRLVPVTPTGVAPATLEQQVAYAQMMSRALVSLPEHLRGSPGDCLAIIDIAQNFGLSPYMVANKTYKPRNIDRMAFESQLYHALLIQSRRLKDPSLNVEYIGEGEARRCRVWGTLVGEDKPREYTAPPLKDVRPGKNDKGQIKGSPLWEDKPDVQQFYDAARDWVRMFCPVATLGLPDINDLRTTVEVASPPRITIKGNPNGEGHKPGQPESELANIANEANTSIAPADQGEKINTKVKGKKGGKGSKAKQKAAEEPPKPNPEHDKPITPAQQPKQPKPVEPGQATDAPEPKVPTKPANAAEYQVYATDYIDRDGDPEAVLKKWESETQMRDQLSVPIKTRNALRHRLETKHGV